jgi:hypothetical protein
VDKWYLRAQGSMEFMVLSGVLLFALIVVLAIVADNTYYMNTKKEGVIAEDIIIKAQKEINLAARMVDGYSRSFALPQKIGNKAYSISVNSEDLSLNTSNHYFWRTIPKVVGQIQIGINTLNKTNGTIYLN